MHWRKLATTMRRSPQSVNASLAFQPGAAM